MTAAQAVAEAAKGGQIPQPALSHSESASSAATAAIAPRPLIGVTAVLLGAVVSTLDGRLTSFGLADMEGAIHAGFDEGAWITTAFTVGQMLMAPISVWLGVVLGPRRLLIWGGTIFAISNFLLPFSPNLSWVLFFQTISGLASGTFIPVTIGFVVQSLPMRLVVYGVSAYAMNLELSLNVAASVEGWFVDHLSWHWIFWDTVALMPLMLLCIHWGMPSQPIKRDLIKTADWAGILYASVGFSLLYAGLDQGNRLDWLNSGTISALLLSGAILVAVFVAHELTHPRPWINLHFIASGNIPFLILLLTVYRLVILSTSLIIPQFLTVVQNYRALEIGGVLEWIAIPQLILAPLIATILLFVEARAMLALGFALIGAACFMAGQVTYDWAGGDFFASQIVQALGQSIGLTALIWFFMKHVQPSHALTFGALLQTTRLFGAELGSGFVQTFIRVREQIHSNLLGLHVEQGAAATDTRLQNYAHALASRSIGSPEASARGVALLAGSIKRQAYVLSFEDGFMVLGFAVVFILVLMLVLRAPPAQPKPSASS